MNVRDFQNKIAKDMFGKTKDEARNQEICVFCHEHVDVMDFKDKLSMKEYLISGLCQGCQDKTFG